MKINITLYCSDGRDVVVSYSPADSSEETLKDIVEVTRLKLKNDLLDHASLFIDIGDVSYLKSEVKGFIIYIE